MVECVAGLVGKKRAFVSCFSSASSGEKGKITRRLVTARSARILSMAMAAHNVLLVCYFTGATETVQAGLPLSTAFEQCVVWG